MLLTQALHPDPFEANGIPPTCNSMQKTARKAETRRILISNESGLHARPVSELVRCAVRFKSEITIMANGKKCSAISIMDIMTADIRKGTEISVTAEGVDADKALEAIEKCLKQLAEKGF
jgi:phosphocarrier protein HPr